MLAGHLPRERTGLDVAALLELQQVSTVAEDRTIGETLQDPLRHAIEPPSAERGAESRAARSARGTGRFAHRSRDARVGCSSLGWIAPGGYETRIDLGSRWSLPRHRSASTTTRLSLAAGRFLPRGTILRTCDPPPSPVNRCRTSGRNLGA